jgi:DCN1-like protein 1/2
MLARKNEIRSDRALFKRVYNHTFILLLEEKAKKTIELEQAEGFWRVLFSPAGLEWKSKSGSRPWLDWWMEFLTAKWGKAVNKDLWRQTLTFAEATLADEGLGFWTEESSWPSVIDEFVEWVQTEKGVGRGGGEEMDVE